MPPDAAEEDLPSEWFSSLTIDRSQPLLQHRIIHKITSLISKVARPVKRGRLASGISESVARKPRSGRVSQIDTSTLARILKILERSVKAGEDIQVFEVRDLPNKPIGHHDPKKAKTANDPEHIDKQRSTSSETGHSGGLAGTLDSIPDISDKDIHIAISDQDKLTTTLTIARNSVLAADCCIALLASDRLTKQVIK